jgi:hypothetical protein
MRRRYPLRLDSDLYNQLRNELVAWKKVRGRKFSMNDLLLEKVGRKLEPAPWPDAEPAGELPASHLTSVSDPISDFAGGAREMRTGMPPPPKFEPEPPAVAPAVDEFAQPTTTEPEPVAAPTEEDELTCDKKEEPSDAH